MMYDDVTDDDLDELADMALHSESDSVRDECSSGMRSEAEEEAGDKRPAPVSRKPGLGATPAHLSLSTTSSLSSCSSQARLVQSSLRDTSGPPPAPPPRTSSATSGSGDNGTGSGGSTAAADRQTDLGKNGSKTTCMQCYLSGHSDGSLDSVDPSTECSSASAETGTGTPSVGAGAGVCQSNVRADRDSGIMEDKFDKFDPTATINIAEAEEQIIKLD